MVSGRNLEFILNYSCTSVSFVSSFININSVGGADTEMNGKDCGSLPTLSDCSVKATKLMEHHP